MPTMKLLKRLKSIIARPVDYVRARLLRARNDIGQVSWVVTTVGFVLGLVGLAGIVEGPIPYIINPHIFGTTLSELHKRISTELFGIGMTVGLIDLISRWHSIQEYKRNLIREMGSPDNGISWRAVTELRETGWLFDRTMNRAKLVNANLRRLGLNRADLSGTFLMEAILEEAKLIGANLEGADLSNANLVLANLQGANLRNAKLFAAVLRDANLQGARLEGAAFDFQTQLPDGTLWDQGADTTFFTEPGSLRFWRSTDPRSPAYRADNDVLWLDLLCNEQDRVNRGCGRLLSIAQVNERAAEAYIRRLYEVISSQEGWTFNQRVSAGMAMALLKDRADRRGFSALVSIPELGLLVRRYLVTIKEFDDFANPEKADGYNREDYWSTEGWGWVRKRKIRQPGVWGEARFALPNYPVVGVSWYEADAFSTFRDMRLPSEREWRRIAGGKDGKDYPWGSEYRIEYANTKDEGLGGTCAVGLFPINVSEEGVFDLVGQVWEWTNTQLPNGNYIVKGGSWASPPEFAKAKYIHDADPRVRDSLRGFRMVRDINT